MAQAVCSAAVVDRASILCIHDLGGLRRRDSRIVYWAAMSKVSLINKWALAGLMCVGLGAWFTARPQDDDPLDSLKVCKDTQKLIFENQFVRVIDDMIPPGVTEPRHRHRHGVAVYLSDYVTEQITDDGKKTLSQRKLGMAQWAEPTIHQVRNTGNTPSHAIRIELKY